MARSHYEAAILKEERVWRKLAKAQKLTFATSRRNHPETMVKGRYQSQYLNLKAVSDEYGDLYTFIFLRRKPSFEIEIEGTPLATLDKLIAAYPLRGTIEAEPGGDPVFYRQLGFETDKSYLRSLFQLLYEMLLLYPQITYLGGEAMLHLERVRHDSKAFQPICTQMMTDISDSTIERFEKIASELWCPRCLARFRAIEISKKPMLYYYGCRACGQSREILHLKEGVTAILDNGSTEEQLFQAEGLNVNWLRRRTLFDFDRVEIIQATDEEVERFAVSIGNDTDDIRRARYQGMEYIISPSCELSPNTLRVLHYTFREAE